MSENQIVVYQPNETMRLDVRLENETVWLNRQQMAQLFGRDVKTIGKHIANALKEELSETAIPSPSSTTATAKSTTTYHDSPFPTVAKFATVKQEGERKVIRQVEYYNLDMILSVGYRVKSPQGILFRRWANTVLKDYLLRGYAVNHRLNQLEDKVDRRFASQDQRLTSLEDKVDFFVQTQTPPLQGVFYDGQLWDAYALVEKLIGSAKKSILLIDNWATVETLYMLAKKRNGVSLTVVTSAHSDKQGNLRPEITSVDVAKFNAQYPTLTVKYSEKFHDRFLILDDKELYLIGASLKDLGRKCFGFTKMDAGDITEIKVRMK